MVFSLLVVPVAHPNLIRTSCQKKCVFPWIWFDSAVTGRFDAGFGDTASYSAHSVCTQQAGRRNSLRLLSHSQDWGSWFTCHLCFMWVVEMFPRTEIVLYLKLWLFSYEKLGWLGWGFTFLLFDLSAEEASTTVLSWERSRAEDKLWWRDLFPWILEQRMICLRCVSSLSLSLTFPSVKGWLKPRLIQVCSRYHR